MPEPAHDLPAAVRAAVAARRPVDARERESVREFLERFDGLASPFDEPADRVHVTASAIVVSDRGVLLHLHKRMNLWLQPGGHIDAGETPWDAAAREAVEETGLPVEPSLVGDDGTPLLAHVDVHPGPRKHRHLDLRYLFTAPPVAPSPPAGESQEVRWFPWHLAVAAADPGLEGILRALQPGEPVLRPARHTDAAECAHVYLRSRDFGLPEVPWAYDRTDVRRWMADEVVGREDVWVAELDGTVVGLLVLSPGWIEHLYLDPAWIGRGLGERFVALAKGRQPGGLQLWTFQSNARARRFYERQGFVAVELSDGAGNAERTPDVRYVWP